MKPAPVWLLPLVLAVAGLVAAFVFLRPAPAASTVEPMPTVAVKKTSVRKATAKRPPRAFRLGYAKGVIRVKPGVDLTKPTEPAKAA